MRALVKLPQHIRDRLRSYRERQGIEEDIAIIRLLSLALIVEEKNYMTKQLEEAIFRI